MNNQLADGNIVKTSTTSSLTSQIRTTTTIVPVSDNKPDLPHMSSATSPDTTAGEYPSDDPPPPPPPPLIPSLPNDVALQCLARTPRLHHPTLALVSKSWRSTLKSPLFYTTRSLLNCTQPLVYLNIRMNNSFNWFILCQNPQNPRTRTLSPIPPIPSQSIGSAFAVLGSKIYVIGGSINDISSPNVWIFDCRFNEWKMGPKMHVGREFSTAGVVDGRIYVMGGCLVNTCAKSRNWAEVFDPVVENWATVASPIEVRGKWMHASAVVKGKVYAMADRGGVVFDPKEEVWGTVERELDLGWTGRGATVNGVLYCCGYLGKITGFDVEDGLWKEVKGIEKGLPKLCGATMANVDGKLVVVWKGTGNGKEMEILCAEVEVWKENDGQIRGSIVWSDVILLVPRGSSIVHCLGVVL